MRAEEWYGKFLRSYRADRSIKRLENNGDYNISRKWTRAMMGLLRGMGEKCGCDVSEEGPQTGRCRNDQRWVKDNASLVCIEHENINDPNIEGEIQKLCNDGSKLKILITYVADRNFEDNVKRLKDKIQNAIHDCRGTFTGEFLLVVGGNHEQDWEAHISVLRMEPLK